MHWSILFVIWSVIISSGMCQTPDVRAFCTQVLESPSIGCDSTRCQDREGKRGPQGAPGMSGAKGEKGDRGPGTEDLQQRLQEDLRNFSSRLAAMEELLTWYRASNGYFYKVFQEKVNFKTAREKCRNYGGILASSGPRNVHVRTELTNLVRESGSSTWLGANDINSEGSWAWEDGVISGEIDWSTSPRQPDNAGGREDCAHYNSLYNYKINDAPCVGQYYFLCEKKMS